MAESNPVSPKVIAGGIWAVVVPVIAAAVVTIVDALSGSDAFASLSPSWQMVINTVLAAVGAVIGAYLKRDEARVNTVPEAEARLQELTEREAEESSPTYE